MPKCNSWPITPFGEPYDWADTNDCCEIDHPCGKGQGDCDDDIQCAGELVCLENRCGEGFRTGADCCNKQEAIGSI